MPEVIYPISGDGQLTLVLRHPEGWEAFEGSETLVSAALVFSQALQTMSGKNRMYAGAWKEQGWQGNVARILSKTSRLRNMLWRDQPVESADEPVQDTLLDLINLAVFALLNRQTRNRWGRGDGSR